MDLLVKQFADQLPDEPFQEIYKALYDKRRILSKQVFSDENILEKITIALKEKLKESENWQFEVEKFEDIRPSLKRVYKRGFNGYRKPKDSRSTEDIHDSR